MGLPGMERRARKLGGTFLIEPAGKGGQGGQGLQSGQSDRSGPSGFKVVVTIPLNPVPDGFGEPTTTHPLP